MSTKLNTMIFVLATAFFVFSVMVSASMIIPVNDNAKENANAPENSPVIGTNWDLLL